MMPRMDEKKQAIHYPFIRRYTWEKLETKKKMKEKTSTHLVVCSFSMVNYMRWPNYDDEDE